MSERAVRAPAKINLRLAVLAKETEGYHQIETLFALIDLADEIRISEGSPGIRLHVEGAELGDPEDNLVVRAARAWFDAAGEAPHLDIRLSKRIPAGAGLGGGSSDAAAMLAALDASAGRPLGDEALLRIAARLGSDVPFFLAGAPYALAWGRGDRCLRLPPPAQRAVLVAIADRPVPTPYAYALLDEEPAAAPPAPLPGVDALSTWDGIAAVATNDFERVLLPRLSGARELLRLFRRNGAEIAALTGSGAAVFGVFAGPEQLAGAWQEVRSVLPRAWLAVSRTAFGSDPQ